MFNMSCKSSSEVYLFILQAVLCNNHGHCDRSAEWCFFLSQLFKIVPRKEPQQHKGGRFGGYSHWCFLDGWHKKNSNNIYNEILSSRICEQYW